MKLYKVTGWAFGWYREKDEFGIVIKCHEGEGPIDTIIRSSAESYAGDLALKEWRLKCDWPEARWIEGPEINLAPEDQQMRLAGAPRLPGMEG